MSGADSLEKNSNKNDTKEREEPTTPPRNSHNSPGPASSVINPFILKYTPENRMQKYCYRHHPDVSCNRQADATQMQEIQESLDKLDKQDREAISHVWSIFSAAPECQRTLLLKGLLAQCCFPQLSQVASMLSNVIRIDYISALPAEISFKILTYLDSTSLCRAAQVCRSWRQMADDDIVWHRLCEQHIDKKCTKCGWGLPLLEKKRLRESRRALEIRAQHIETSASKSSDTQPTESNELSSNITTTTQGCSAVPSDSSHPVRKRTAETTDEAVVKQKRRRTRPWKEVYAERYNIEANWRNGRYRTLEFKHYVAVTALQFDEQYLITGTFDGAANVWDIETGKLVRKLVGHLRGVNALKFDSAKLITGSYDKTVRVWNYRTGECVCTFRGHEGSVLCLDFDQKLIASGSTDCNIKVWNFQSKTCFTLRGHRDWIHSVKIHSGSNTLYSSSEDATIRMWDLETKQCIKVFSAPGSKDAHVAQVPSVLPLFIDHLETVNDGVGCASFPEEEVAVESEGEADANPRATPGTEEEERTMFNDSMIQRRSSDELGAVGQAFANNNSDVPEEQRRPTHLLSGSLDSTIKLWDVKTGKCVRTLFGHIEGIWGIAADNFRVVSGSHDKLVKVWDLQSGRHWHTFSGHTGPVCCVGLSDTRLASGGDDGLVRMLCFDDFGNEFRSS